MEFDFAKVKKVFFLGIGGIGISAIARMMHLEGKEVSGSDMSKSQVTHELESLGINVMIGQGLELIPKDTDLIVYTIAIPHYDPGLFEQIKKSEIPYKSYPEMLAYVTQDKYTIAISGTHGKTTTTAMIGKMLIDTGKDPSLIVGSLLKEYNSNLIVGKGEYFVVEACEYERSFLNIHPKILIITNLEVDHLDYYKDLEDIQKAFGDLVGQTKGWVVCNPNDPALVPIITNTNLEVVDYTKYLSAVPALIVPGQHNRMNAACALAVGDILKVSMSEAGQALANFAGTWRRLEKRGASKEGTIIYDDYAHHPTEIRASLSGLREIYPSNKIIVVFQPHLYSRTKALFTEFIDAFDLADEVILLPIYFAREAPDPDISSEKLAQAIHDHGTKVSFAADFGIAKDQVIAMNLKEGDVFVTMGAGEAYKIGDELLHTS